MFLEFLNATTSRGAKNVCLNLKSDKSGSCAEDFKNATQNEIVKQFCFTEIFELVHRQVPFYGHSVKNFRIKFQSEIT